MCPPRSFIARWDVMSAQLTSFKPQSLFANKQPQVLVTDGSPSFMYVLRKMIRCNFVLCFLSMSSPWTAFSFPIHISQTQRKERKEVRLL